MQTKKQLLRIFLISLGCLLQGALNDAPLEAALQTREVLTVEAQPPQELREEEHYLNLREHSGWEKRFFGEKLFQQSPQNGLRQSQDGASLQLKSPGKLPGIELGVEMHSLQAFQTVIPPENLPKGVDLKQEQPLLLPPSINAPDYNGGFLRFTW
jgi:hypothetical protein